MIWEVRQGAQELSPVPCLSSSKANHEEREAKEYIRQVAAANKPNSLRFSDDTKDLRQIIKLRPDSVPDLPQLLAPVSVRIDGPADTVIVVTRRFLNHFFQG